jgi:acyl-coenzyme A thioesterase PaaI-like protein
MAHAARSPRATGGDWFPGVVTVEMKTSFLLPAEGRLVAAARCLRRTASLAFCEATMTRPDGEITAHATGTFKFLRGLPAGAGGREVRRPTGGSPSPTP